MVSLVTLWLRGRGFNPTCCHCFSGIFVIELSERTKMKKNQPQMLPRYVGYDWASISIVYRQKITCPTTLLKHLFTVRTYFVSWRYILRKCVSRTNVIGKNVAAPKKNVLERRQSEAKANFPFVFLKDIIWSHGEVFSSHCWFKLCDKLSGSLSTKTGVLQVDLWSVWTTKNI